MCGPLAKHTHFLKFSNLLFQQFDFECYLNPFITVWASDCFKWTQSVHFFTYIPKNHSTTRFTSFICTIVKYWADPQHEIICNHKLSKFNTITTPKPPDLLFAVNPTEQQTVVLLPRSPSSSKTYFPIPVDNLEEEYRLRSADDGKLFREEYNVSISPVSPEVTQSLFWSSANLAQSLWGRCPVICGIVEVLLVHFCINLARKSSTIEQTIRIMTH